MRLRSFGSLCAILAALSASSCEYRSLASIREQKICAANPGLCVDGRLVAERVDNGLTIPRPELTVASVNCFPFVDEVHMAGNVRNQGMLPTPGYIDASNAGLIDISATVNPGTSFAQSFLSQAKGLAAMGQPGDHYQARLDAIPNADPANFPPTYFQVYVNPPEPGYPYGKIWEWNLQDNYACGLCQCQNNTCTTTQTQQQCTGLQ